MTKKLGRPLKPREDPGLAAAITAAESITALAVSIGTTPQNVAQWPRVPGERVLAVEASTGVPRHVLRPDIYPPPRRAKRVSLSAHV